MFVRGNEGKVRAKSKFKISLKLNQGIGNYKNYKGYDKYFCPFQE